MGVGLVIGLQKYIGVVVGKSVGVGVYVYVGVGLVIGLQKYIGVVVSKSVGVFGSGGVGLLKQQFLSRNKM